MRVRSQHLAWLVALVLIGAVLRFYGIGREPLRGDEAFAVRYWASSSTFLLNDKTGLAWREPHPLGTFFLFGAWKALVGESEIAMRLLPALLNLLGIPALYVIGQRCDRRTASDNVIYQKKDHPPLKPFSVGRFAALLWAINPFLIWHSQDVRNYAIWAGLAAVSLWTMVRLFRPNPSRWDWAAFAVVNTAALYVFFLHGFLILAYMVFILVQQRERLQIWVVVVGGMSIACFPLFYQAVRLAGSGYQGALTPAEGGKLAQFASILLWGETLPLALRPFAILASLFIGGLCLAAAITMGGGRSAERRTLGLCSALIGIPLVLLIVAAGRLAVFDARYLIGSLPALLMIVVLGAEALPRLLGQGVIALCVGISLAGIVGYHAPDYHKAPDWYGLRDYLLRNANTGGTLLMVSLDPATGVLDPALDYYVRHIHTLPFPLPGADMPGLIRERLEHGRVWFIPSGEGSAEAEAVLRGRGVLISDDRAGRSFLVRQYRAPTLIWDEPDKRLSAAWVNGARLNGYGLTGIPNTGGALTLILYWETPPPAGVTTFVHLLTDPSRPPTAQADKPSDGTPRDLYRLDLTKTAPAEYGLVIGLYDPLTNTRIPLSDGTTGLRLETVSVDPEGTPFIVKIIRIVN